MTTPPSAGDSTAAGVQPAARPCERFGQGRCRPGVLQHQGALEIAVAVQARRKTEVALEQRSGAPEGVEELIVIGV